MDTSTSPGPAPDATPPAPPSNSFFAGIRRLGITRGDDRWIGGVASGLADRFGLDPLLVRGILAASMLLGGFGLVAYGLAWALLPERTDGRIHLEEMILGRFDMALLGALAFVIVGFGRGDSWFFWGPPAWIQGLLWLVAAGVMVAIVVVLVNKRPSAPLPPRRYPPVYQPPAAPQYGQQYGQQYSQPVPAPPYGPPAPPVPYGAQQTGHHGTPYGAQYAQPVAPAAQPAPAYVAAPVSYGTPPPPPQRPARIPNPPKPRRPRVPGVGAGTVGVVVALSLLTLAVLLVAERTGDFDGPVALTALGVGIVLCGLGIIVSGLRGRTSGGLGGLAVLGLLVAVPLGAVSTTSWFTSSDGDRQFSAQDIMATDRAEAATGYTMGFGDATVDLTGLPLNARTLEVPISLAAGDLTIIVPSGATIDANVDVGAGTITWDVDGVRRSHNGAGLTDQSFSTGDVGANGPELRLTVSLGAGEVRIVDDAATVAQQSVYIPAPVPVPVPVPTLPGLPGEEN